MLLAPHASRVDLADEAAECYRGWAAPVATARAGRAVLGLVTAFRRPVGAGRQRAKGVAP